MQVLHVGDADKDGRHGLVVDGEDAGSRRRREDLENAVGEVVLYKRRLGSVRPRKEYLVVYEDLSVDFAQAEYPDVDHHLTEAAVRSGTVQLQQMLTKQVFVRVTILNKQEMEVFWIITVEMCIKLDLDL